MSDILKIEPIVSRIHKNRYRLLLISVLIMLVLYPYLAKSKTGDFLLILINIMIMFSSLIPFYSKKMHFIFFLYSSVICTIITIYILRLFYGEGALVIHVTGLVGFLLLYLYLIFKIFQDIFYRKVITSETISGGICVYILCGLVWAIFYEMLSSVSPGAFTQITPLTEDIDFIFYSFSTLTTLGEGGISPNSSLAKSLSLIELIFGVMYTTIFLAKLVASYSGERKGED